MYQEMLARLEKNRHRSPAPAEFTPAEDEIAGIHEPIIRWCRAQVPNVPYIYSRPDKKSTVNKGVPDLAVFYRKHPILIEAKSRTGKCSTEQLAWHMMAECQGFQVSVIRSYEEFVEIVKNL